MLAALYRATGPAEKVLELAELPDPEPGPGEVRVRLRFSGINPTDVKARAGHRGRPLPFDHQIPGQDGAGEIDRVGPGVQEARIGERVWVFHAAYERPQGTSAQYVTVPEWQAVPLGHAPYELGAQLGIPFLTAHRCLLRDGPIAGRTVLVAGGAGAVGNAAVQVARHAGAEVVTTVSSQEKAELARRAGAGRVVIGYDKPDEVGPVHRIVEVALATNLEHDLAVLETGGAIVTYATEPHLPELPIGQLMYKNARLDFVLVYLTPRADLEAGARDLTAWLADLVALPHRAFGLDAVAEAHAYAETAPTGRVLVEIP